MQSPFILSTTIPFFKKAVLLPSFFSKRDLLLGQQGISFSLIRESASANEKRLCLRQPRRSLRQPGQSLWRRKLQKTRQRACEKTVRSSFPSLFWGKFRGGCCLFERQPPRFWTIYFLPTSVSSHEANLHSYGKNKSNYFNWKSTHTRNILTYGKKKQIK